MVGCASPSAGFDSKEKKTGKITLSVNPKIELMFDEAGKVESVTPLNKDGENIVAALLNTSGQETRDTVVEIVRLIVEKGYLKLEDQGKHIKIEIEEGSFIPSADFMKNIVGDVKVYLQNQDLNNHIIVEDDSQYDLSDFGESDYDKRNQDQTSPGGAVVVDVDGHSDYDDSNYETKDDDSDYDDSDYDDSKYGNKKPVVPKTNPKKDDDSPYDDSNYDDSKYDEKDDDTDYDDSKYDDKDDDTNYDDSKYDDKDDDSNYDDKDDDSNYDESDYDDSNYNG